MVFMLQDEFILIFMEYCDGGTLDSVCREGLDEYLMRQYTHLILRGINDLHEHLIVHRDIKRKLS